jgi:hypothetical protein
MKGQGPNIFKQRLSVGVVSEYSQLFFIRFESNLSEYGSYSLHIHMFRYIHIIRLIFGSKYSQGLEYKYSISCKTNTCCNKYSLQSEYLQSEYLLNIFSYWQIFFKIFVYKRIFAKLSVNFTFRQIFVTYCYCLKLYRKAFTRGEG